LPSGTGNQRHAEDWLIRYPNDADRSVHARVADCGDCPEGRRLDRRGKVGLMARNYSVQ
jgi:hypothetical protein